MKTKSKPIWRASWVTLMGMASLVEAGVIIDSGVITADANGNWGSREATRTLNGYVDGGGRTADNSVTLVGGMDPNNPADFSLDATAGGNLFVGQNANWSYQGVSQEAMWIRYDLGQDYKLDSLNIWTLAVNTSNNETDWTVRCAQNVDIWYRNELSGPGNNVGATGNAGVGNVFDPTGWTLVGTSPSATLTRSVEASTAIAPDNVAMGGVSARYVTIRIASNYSGGSDNNSGIAEVQFFEDDSAPIDDPVLGLDADTAFPDFNFEGVFDSTEERSVTFVNNSAGGSGIITIESATTTISDDGSGTFGSLVTTFDAGNTATPPQLADGDKVTFSVTATNSEPAADFIGTLTIDTTSSNGSVGADHNDTSLALNASTIVPGSKLNPNPNMEAGLSEWQDNALASSPGLAPGSGGMAVIATSQSQLLQNNAGTAFIDSALTQADIPDGASDWQMSAYFTPVQKSVFGRYNVFEGEELAAESTFADRSFQWVLFNDDSLPPSGQFGLTSVRGANAIINLGYFPDGVQGNAVEDFYVWNGAAWVATGVISPGTELLGSIDAEINTTDDPVGDGSLNPADGDTVNGYRIVVTGRDFGTSSAEYDITVFNVTGTDTGAGGSVSGLTVFNAAQVNDTTGIVAQPGGISFFGLDDSPSNTGDGAIDGVTAPFWVDDVCFFSGTAPARKLDVAIEPSTIVADAPTMTSATTSLVLLNSGTTESIDVSSLDFGSASFSLVSPATPFTIPAGNLQTVTIQWNSTVSPLATYERSTVTVNSNDPTNPALEIGIDGSDPSEVIMDVIANCDFETPGTDAVGDTDTFASWEESFTDDQDNTSDPTTVTDVAALFAGSGSAISLGALDLGPPVTGQAYAIQAFTDNLSDFDVDLDFELGPTARQFNLVLQGSGSQVNIRYQSGGFDFFSNTQGNTGWVRALTISLTGPHKMKLLGRGWGTLRPTSQIQIFDGSDTLIGDSGPVSLFRDAVPTDSQRVISIQLASAFGNASGWTADNVCVQGRTLDTEVIVPGGDALEITDSSIVKATGAISLTVTGTVEGIGYQVQASNDLGQVDPFADNVVHTENGAAGTTIFTFTDTATSVQDKRFYRVVEP